MNQNLRKAPETFVSAQSLRSNFSWMLLGNLVYAVSQWGLVIAITQTGTPQMMGQFALGLAISAPVVLFLNLHLRAILATDARADFSFSEYFSLRASSSLLSILLIAVISALAGYPQGTITIILLITLSKVIESLSDLAYGLFQREETMQLISLSKILRGLLSLLALSAVLLLGGSLSLAVLALVFSWLLVFLFHDLPRLLAILARRNERLEWTGDRPAVRKLIRLALPMGVVVLLISLSSNLPRYLIERQVGEAALGIFSALAYLMVAGGQVSLALWQSVIPRFSTFLAEGDTRAFRSLFLKLSGIALLLGLGGFLIALLLGKPLLGFLYGTDYARESSLFVWLMLGAGLSYQSSLFGTAITAARKFDIQLPMNLFFLALTALLSFWLIPRYHLLGAAWVLIANFAVQIPVKALVLHRVVQETES